MTKKLDGPQLLLLLALFLAPLTGGQISTDQVPFDGFFGVLSGDASVPSLSHALLSIPIGAAFLLLLRRRVLQVPNATLAVVMLLFFGLIGISVGLSAFRLTSLSIAFEWFAYALAFFTTVATIGRTEGPRLAMSASFIGCVFLALRGVSEYGQTKAIDPTWRIFAGWVNPNATAAMLMVGLFLGLGLLLTESRVASLLTGIGTVVVATAIILTQSKGVFGAAAVGAVVFLVVSVLAMLRGNVSTLLLRVFALGLAISVIVAGLAFSSRSSGAAGGSALSRVTNANATSEQSSDFRKLLWRGAIKVTAENPFGSGIGTYRYESGRSGLHTQTHLAHSSFLQLAQEGGPLLAGLLIVAGLLWIRLIFRGWTHQPVVTRLRIAAVFSTVTALFVHAWIDSDLSYFGIGLTFFMLLGVGLLLSGDAVAPEFIFPNARRAGGFAVTLLIAFGLFIGIGELRRASARAALLRSDFQAAALVLADERASIPIDGEAWYLTAQIAPDPEQRFQAAQRAAQLSPTNRNLRLLARLQVDRQQLGDAESTLRDSLKRDPNNLPTLAQLASLQDLRKNEEGARATRERLVAVEKTTYFLVRSLPDLIPTETYAARIQLAQAVTGKARIDLLQPAIDGYLEYVNRTVPQIKTMAKQDPPADYAGESIDKARIKLKGAAEAANQLAIAYRAAGDPAAAAKADLAASAFESAFDK